MTVAPKEKQLTVVVPSYNVGPYIERCISSMLDRRCIGDVEILVVNDGSTDNTRELAERYQSTYPGSVRVVNKANGGHGSALNVGVSEATGRYFRVVDGDDWVDSDTFADYVEFLKECGSDVVVSDYQMVFENRRDARRVCFGMPGDREFAFDAVASCLGEMTIHSIAYRTAMLKGSGAVFTENCYYEDSEYILYPLVQAQTIRFFGKAVYQYRIGRQGQSISLEAVVRNSRMLYLIMLNLIEFGERARGMHLGGVQEYIDRLVVSRIRSYYGVYLKAPFSLRSIRSIEEFSEELEAMTPYYYGKSNEFWIARLRRHPALLYPVIRAAFGMKRLIRGF